MRMAFDDPVEKAKGNERRRRWLFLELASEFNRK